MNPEQDGNLSVIYPPNRTVEITTKALSVVVAEGALYFIIGAGAQVITTLTTGGPLDGRAITILVTGALVAGANSVKAYLSNSMSRP